MPEIGLTRGDQTALEQLVFRTEREDILEQWREWRRDFRRLRHAVVLFVLL